MERALRRSASNPRLQFTSSDWIDELKEAKVKISMDRKGRMIERLWRSHKYECVYLRAFETGAQARENIGQWLAYYNADRPHSRPTAS
jgi:putative transposase